MEQQLHELLCECTVRVSISGKVGHGTGFFVAPGFILTCTHVIKTALSDVSQIQVSWKGYPARVTKLQQEQDLALLQVNLLDHPCVYLREDAYPLDDLYSYGYTDDHPDGDPATFILEGKTGEQEEHLKFKFGQVRPGLSGAPLLNVRTGYVCGIVRLTRDKNNDAGGRAIPVSTVFQVFPDIADLQQSFHRQNQQWVSLLENYLLDKPIEGKLIHIEAVSEATYANTGQIIEDFQEFREGQEEILSLLSARSMQRSQTPFILPRLDIPDFTGRTKELEELKDLLLAPGSSHTVGIAGLSGTGGMGKSTLACHFATRYRDHFPDGVIGVEVGHKAIDELVQEFAYHADVEIDPKQYSATALMQKIFGNRRALLIFDNAEDASVQKLHPGGEKCAVIVTTRNRNLFKSLKISLNARIDLEGFTFEETKEFFIRLLGERRVNDELEALQKIYGLAGGHPLALRIIGGALQDRKLTTLEKYAARLEKEKQRLSSFLKDPDDSELNVHASFTLSLNSLEEEERLLFACLGACAPEGFNLSTAQAASNLDEDSTTDGIVRLCQLSLVNQGTTDGRYMLHPLLFNFAREEANKQGILKSAEQRLTEYFVAYVEEHKALYPTDFAALERELNALLLTGIRLIDDTQQANDIKQAIDFYMILKPFLLSNRGYPSQASEWLQKLLSAARKQQDLFYEIFCLLQCESISQQSARYAEAEKFLEESEKLLEKVEDATQRNPLLAMLRAKQGSLHRIHDNVIAAEKKFKEALSLWTDLGRQWERGKVLNKLGALYASCGKMQEAEDALIESLEIYEQLNDLMRKGKVLNTLSKFYERLGKMYEAEWDLQEALKIAEQIGDRKSIGMLHGRLGGIYKTQGQEKEAEDSLQKALSIATEMGDIRTVVIVVSLLKDILISENKTQDALDLLWTHLELTRKTTYKEGIARLLNFIGEFYLSQKQLPEAEEVLQEAITIAKEASIPNVIAEVLKTLGKMYNTQKNHQKSLKVLQESIQFIQSSIEHGNTTGSVLILLSLGHFYQHQKWYDQASICFQKCFEIQEAIRSPLIGKTTQVLVYLLLLLHRRDQARYYCERALTIVPDDPPVLKIQNRLFQRNDEESLLQRVEHHRIHGQMMTVAQLLHKLGVLYLSEKKFDQAEAVFLESLEIGRNLQNPKHMGIVLKSLGEIFLLQGRMQQAQEAFDESYTLAARMQDKHAMANVQQARGRLLLERDQFAQAYSCLKESFALYEELHNPSGIHTLYFLGKTLIILNKLEEARTYCQRAQALWPIDARMDRTARYLLRKIATQVSTRKVGRIKRLLPADIHGAPYGFIAPDDGSQDIYFKQEIVEKELLERLRPGTRVYADTQFVKGRPQAIQIGREADLQLDEGGASPSDTEEEVDFPTAEAEVQTASAEEEADPVSEHMLLRQFLTGEKGEDEATLRQLLASAQAEDNAPEQAQLLYRLGKLYQADNKIALAEEAYTQSISIGRTLQLTRHTGIVLKSLGEIFALQGRIQQAEEAFEESYTLAATNSDLLDMAETQRWRGRLLLDHGEIERASTYFQKSFAIYEEIPNKLGVKVLFFLMRTLLILKKIAEAHAYWQHARTLWPDDVEMLEMQNRLEQEFSLSLQQPVRKVGRMIRLIPTDTYGAFYGFIAPDDGSEAIYFKQDAVANELREGLRPGMRVYADTQFVKGRPQAIQIGREADLQLDEDGALPSDIEEEVDFPAVEAEVQTASVEEEADIGSDVEEDANTVSEHLLLHQLPREEPEEDEATLRQLLESAQAEDNAPEQAQLLYRLSKLYQADNKIAQAEEAYAQSISIGRTLQLTRHTGIVLKSLGEIFALQGRIQQAEEAFEESYTLAATNSDLLDMVSVQTARGKLLLEHNRFERAFTYLQESFTLCEKLRNRQRVRILYFLMRALMLLHPEEEAQAYWQYARNLWPDEVEALATLSQLENEIFAGLLKISKTSTLPNVVAEASKTLEKRDQVQKNYPIVLEVLQESIPFIQSSIEYGNTEGHTASLVTILLSLGDFYQHQKRYDQASICFQKCFEIQEASRSPLIGKTTQILVHLLQLLHKREQARYYCERALAIVPDDSSLLKLQNRLLQSNDEEGLLQRVELHKAQGQMVTVAQLLHKLGAIYLSEKKFDQAEVVFLESLEIGRNLQYPKHMGIVLKSLGEIFLLQGRMQQAQEAFDESYALATQIKDRYTMATIQETRGRLLMECDQFEQAYPYLKESFALYEELHNPSGIQTLYFLGKTLIILNKLEEAQAYCQRAQALWPGDGRTDRTVRYLLRKIATHVPPRKIGCIKRLIPSDPHKVLYGFIAPDDGSQDIYFKHEVVEKELFEHLRPGMRVYADIQIIDAKTRALKVGKAVDTGSSPKR